MQAGIILSTIFKEKNPVFNLPRAARIAADQSTSPHRAGKNNNPPIRPPKASCNGSNIVT